MDTPSVIAGFLLGVFVGSAVCICFISWTLPKDRN